jgi:hypothetical protein
MRALKDVNIKALNVTVLHRKHTLFSLQNNCECCWGNNAVSSHNLIKHMYRVWSKCGSLILKLVVSKHTTGFSRAEQMEIILLYAAFLERDKMRVCFNTVKKS